jgi:hypothetical protein
MGVILLRIVNLSVTIPIALLCIVLLGVVMLSVLFSIVMSTCRSAEYRYAE